ncbi:hypothetical protein ScPMuIL_009435 [Solemya velum]
MSPNQETGPTDLMDTDISFSLARLFDPYNLDHIPESKRLSLFKERDIAHVKHYKAAVKIFGGPLSRKRLIIAPPMETPLKHRLGMYHDRKSPPVPPILNSALQPQLPPQKPVPKEKILEAQEIEREESYHKWMRERKQFRDNLENMGLNKEWLQSKPNKTEMEKRVLKKLVRVKMMREQTPEIEINEEEEEEPILVPKVKVPAPDGIKIIERHLRRYHLRLLDLFKQSDKNKDWGISREEFRNIIRLNKIPMSEEIMEDLILTLDADFNDRLDYQELSRGMERWKKERRDNKRKQLSRESTAVSLLNSHGSFGESASKLFIYSLSPSPTGTYKPSTLVQEVSQLDARLRSRSPTPRPRSTEKRTSLTKVTPDIYAVGPKKVVTEEQIVGAEGTEIQKDRISSPKHLIPPKSDLRPEQRVMSEEAMVDLRKRDRSSLQAAHKPEDPGVIKIGDTGVDNHCTASTMTGEIGEMVDRFRQLKLKEFHDIIKLCHEKNVPLSEELLERVLLYPDDRPYPAIAQKIRPPGMPLISAHFADPPKRPPTPIEVRHKDKVRRSKSGQLMIDSRHIYPQNSAIAPILTKANLSTGRAIVKRKVDCWMTFEDYNRLTSHLAVRYQQLHGSVDDNAFWPGHLLDKLRLCMPPYDKHVKWNKSDILFSRMKTQRPTNIGYNSGNSAWPINQYGCVQVGIHDPYRNKY